MNNIVTRRLMYNNLFHFIPMSFTWTVIKPYLKKNLLREVYK